MRASFQGSTACYLLKDDKVLFLKFQKKWGRKYAPPGGKMNQKESALECIKREFKEETGINLLNPKLKGIAHWIDDQEGMIYIFIATEYDGDLIEEGIEGRLEWINISELDELEQFQMNKTFTPYLFKEGVFIGKFILDNNTDIIEYSIDSV